MVKTRSFQVESDSSTMAVPKGAKKLSSPVSSADTTVQMTSSSTTTTTTREMSTKSSKKVTVAKKASSAKGHARGQRLSRDELITGTEHIHFHEHIRIQNKKKKGKSKASAKNQQQKQQQDDPEVVKMSTGTLFIFRGSQRRVVFVRNK